MSSTRLLPLLKTVTQKTNFRTIASRMCHRNLRRYTCCNLNPQYSPHLPEKRPYSSKSVEQKLVDEEESLLIRIARKIPFLNVNKHRMNVIGLILYESIADQIPYITFFDEYCLPDTFYSWFVLTELHVWLLTVRCMAEGDDGRLARNRLIEAMWSDVGFRVKKLGAGNSPLIRKQVAELSEQFQAALVGYDEGLQTDDVTLAGAIWRRIYQMRDVDPDHLDSFVKYIRTQVVQLDKLSTNDLFKNKSLQWNFEQKK